MYKHRLNQLTKLDKQALCFIAKNINLKAISFTDELHNRLNKENPLLYRHAIKLLNEHQNEVGDCNILLLESEFLSRGPKLYTLQPSTCEALENVELNFDIDHYRQPFPIICLDYSQEQLEQRFIRNNIFLSSDQKELAGVQFVPDYALLKHTQGSAHELEFYVRMKPFKKCNNEKYITSHIQICLQIKEGKTIEEGYQHLTDKGILKFTTFENMFVKSILRTMCNMSMLILERGQREIPDPHREKLLARVEKGVKNDNDLFELKTRPQNFTLNQDIDLFRRKDVYVRSGNKTGKKVRPHWRNGHWRSQRHGEKWSLLKQIFVEPVYVNVKYLEGSLSDTMVNYREG